MAAVSGDLKITGDIALTHFNSTKDENTITIDKS